MLKTLLLIGAAAIGGIYLTSEEGKNARGVLLKKKDSFIPIAKELLVQAQDALEGSKDINSDEVRANVERLVGEARETLHTIDLEQTLEEVKVAISVASKKIRLAFAENQKAIGTSSNKEG